MPLVLSTMQISSIIVCCTSALANLNGACLHADYVSVVSLTFVIKKDDWLNGDGDDDNISSQRHRRQ